MQTADTPIMVDVYRGESIESRHRVHAVIADVDGIHSSWGDAERLTMPRSAIKSIQALVLLESGAAEHFHVSDDEIALAAASHSAEAGHTQRVQQWLERIGLGVDELECGPSDPIDLDAMHALYTSGGSPTRLHNCCSGKHAGMLTTIRHLENEPGFELPGYLNPRHGVQVRVRHAQQALTGVDLESQTPVVDGCGIPVYQFPLQALAQAMARLATPERVPERYAPAAAKVVSVLPDRSWLVSGTGRADDILTQAATEPLIIKGGAEAVSMGVLPERGIGFALKCEDGSHRAVDEAVAALLHKLEATPERVSPNSPIRNRAGDDVGRFSVQL